MLQGRIHKWVNGLEKSALNRLQTCPRLSEFMDALQAPEPRALISGFAQHHFRAGRLAQQAHSLEDIFVIRISSCGLRHLHKGNSKGVEPNEPTQ
jgi:hypothetical protein